MTTTKKTTSKKVALAEPKRKASASKKPVCKEGGCFEDVQVKGFCRLHFLKAVKAKSLKHDDEFEEARKEAGNRRKSSRFELPDAPPSSDEAFLSRESERLSELDLDIDEFELEDTVKKTG
jgi:hypothetical protein